jgi:uncharacterized protein YndB with AHSA1/START domain/effector-binding domain-containing protein
MFFPDSFQVTTPNEREIEIVRDFDAPRQLVFDAFTKPELVRQWLLGPEGWTMPVCEIDLRTGGRYRYVWRKNGVPDMGIGGVFREIAMPSRIVATEKFDEAWYPGEAINTTTFTEQASATRVTITMLYESQEARNTARRSGMEHGMAATFNRLEQMLPSLGSASISEPEVVQVSPQPAAVIYMKIPREDMPHEMPGAIKELLSTIAAQGRMPAGPLFCHHLTLSSMVFDFEAGFPIDGAIEAQGRVKPGELPAAKIARTIYQGPYEGLFRAWGEFGEWQKREGVTGRGDIWERYVAGPESSPDPANWRTELCLPLKN